MFFSNLSIYRLVAPWTQGSAELEAQLAQRPLASCGPYDMQTRGWVGVAADGRLVLSHGNQHLIALGAFRKLLPATIIRQEAEQRAQGIAAEQGFPVGRRQMRELKERVADELRARALVKRSVVRIWIDAEHGWVVVDAAGAARAEECLQTLRETLGSLEVVPLGTARSPAVAMSSWLVFGEAPGRFQVEQDLELQSLKDPRSLIRYVRHPIEGRDVQQQIASGKSVTRLGLSWNSRVAFLLTAKLELRRIEFLDVLTEKDDGTADGTDERLAAEFALMTGELAALLGDLVEQLGGVAGADASLAA